jgi:hypothetical protein
VLYFFLKKKEEFVWQSERKMSARIASAELAEIPDLSGATGKYIAAMNALNMVHA